MAKKRRIVAPEAEQKPNVVAMGIRVRVLGIWVWVLDIWVWVLG